MPFIPKPNKIQKLQLKTKKLTSNWTVRYIKFSGGKDVLNVIIYGMIANVSPTTIGGRERLQKWKRKIAIEIRSKRGNDALDQANQLAVSVGMRFHAPTHGNQKLDLDNFIKPIIDGIAAGLFSEQIEDLSQLSRYNQFDDSNFRYLYVEHLPDASGEDYEGISIVISRM